MKQIFNSLKYFELNENVKGVAKLRAQFKQYILRMF